MSKGASKRSAAARPAAKREPVKSKPVAPPEPEVESLVTFADGDDASAFATMLGGLIEANVNGRPEKRSDFDTLRARVGIEVDDIEEAVTLDFEAGHLTVHNGLKPRRQITISADAETVMQLSSLRIGPLGIPVYYDATGRGIATKLLTRKLKIDGIPSQIDKLNKVTRLFSVT